MGSITQISSRKSLEDFLTANPKAILGFHASWLRGSASLVESVLLATATAAAAPGTMATMAGDAIPTGEPLLLFIAGDRSKVGKSSICLALLGALLRLGFHPSHLAYIKPATQCEAPQLVTAWCDSMGISNRGVGPVVFYKGFTREFLKGNLGTSKDLVREACAGVHAIGKDKKIVLVDGVGYPAVGSICGGSKGLRGDF
eukprot:evm.model.NODE_25915_length_48178_cov_38.282433.4